MFSDTDKRSYIREKAIRMSSEAFFGGELKHFSASEVGFFEGPEKLLEIWFNLASEESKGLRHIPRYELEKILDIAQCKILSYCGNLFLDAYLLSESTLLVSSHRFILKTCGNTTLLSAIPPLILLVSKYYPAAEVMNLYYSHRSFQEPLLQPQPHSNFDLEVSYLRKIFKDGVSKSFGRGEDVWYLYGLEKQKLEIHDQTLEILMNDLNPDFMALFSTCAFSCSDDLIKTTGISNLMPEATIDAKIFEPCGFSLNAIDKDVYYTIHVTPQVECSWVSFETNVEMKRCLPLIKKVLALFHPRKAALSLMTNEGVVCSDVKSAVEMSEEYVLLNSESSSLSAYNVIYLELHSKEDLNFLKETDDGCLSKATGWTKALSKHFHAWLSKKKCC